VMALDAEGARAAAVDLDLAGSIGLYPDRGLAFVEEAEHRSEDEVGH
jgi:hypothetical protein